MSDYDSGIWSLQEIRDNIIEGSWKDYVSKGDLSNVYTAGNVGNISIPLNISSCCFSSPVQIPGTQWKKFSHYSAVRDDGTLWVWGSVICGRTGLNETAGSGKIYSSPVQIPGTNWVDAKLILCSAIALKGDGTLWTWGNSNYGVLGNNTTSPNLESKSPSYCNVSSPVQIPGTNWCFVTKTQFSAAAIKTNGTLWVWGVNSEGQLGLNDRLHRSSPVQIPGTNWCCVEMSDTYTSFALKKDGTLWAWGFTAFGGLGAGSGTVHVSSPVQIPGTQWNGIYARRYVAFGTKNDGSLWGWGYPTENMLGPVFGTNNTTCCISSPIQIPGTQWTNNIVGHQCIVAALKTDGTMWVWGTNPNGQSGAGVNGAFYSPIAIGGCSWSGLDAGECNVWMRERINCYNPACEPLTNYEGCGQLWVWGTSCSGGFGLGTDIGPTVSGEYNQGCIFCQQCVAPFPIKGPYGIWKCVSSASHGNPQGSTTAGIKNDNTLWIWGRNRNGILGLNDVIDRSFPEQIPGTQWCNVSVGPFTTLAVKTDNTLWAWGDNSFGHLGQNSTVHRSSPVQIPGTQWCFVSMGSETPHSAAIKTDGTLWMWGFNDNGQVGDNTRTCRSSPVQIPGTQWCKVCVSVNRTFALKTDGTLWAWGSNFNGVLGQSNCVNRSSPVQIPGTQWCAVSNSCNVLALKTDNTLWAWGTNTRGALGQNSTEHRSSPTQIPGTQWCAIKVGDSFALAIKRDGTLFSWGSSCLTDSNVTNRNSGRLGNFGPSALPINRSSPMQVPGTQWKDFATGDTDIFSNPTPVFALKGTTPF